MERLIKSRSEVKQYAVYAHYYKGIPFYVGSGEVYRNSRGLRGRPFNFANRNTDWFFFCNGEIDKVTVEILFVTDDVKLSLDKEEKITRYYMGLEVPLVNVDIGNKRGEEWIKKHASGENHPMWGKRGKDNPMWGEKGYWYGKKHTKETRERISKNNARSKKVLVINNETNEEKIFDSITKAYQFIVESGFDKTQVTLHRYLNKGLYNFKDYAIELTE